MRRQARRQGEMLGQKFLAGKQPRHKPASSLQLSASGHHPPVLLRHVKYTSNGVIAFGCQWQELLGLLVAPGHLTQAGLAVIAQPAAVYPLAKRYGRPAYPIPSANHRELRNGNDSHTGQRLQSVAKLTLDLTDAPARLQGL